MSEIRITDEATCLKGEMLIVQSRTEVLRPKTVIVSFDELNTKEFVLSSQGLLYGPLEASYEVTTSAQAIELTCVPQMGGFPWAEIGLTLLLVLPLAGLVKRLLG